MKYRGEESEAVRKKGPKKPRKGKRAGRSVDSSLPERAISNFSVTKVLSQLGSAEAVPGKHADELESLQDEIIKEFPIWIYHLRLVDEK